MGTPAAHTKIYFALCRGLYQHPPRRPAKMVLWRAVLYWKRLGPLVPVWNQVEPGLEMFLDPYDFVPAVILVTGAWEPKTWAIISEHLPEGGTFIDVGAHIGYHSLKAARKVGGGGHVVAIEPNPLTLQQLRSNVQRNRGFMIAIEPVACSDSEAVLDFFGAGRSNTGASSLSRENASERGTPVSYRVRARPLDDVVREMNLLRVDVVKIDVQGAEMKVLQGANETLSRFHPALVIEITDPQLAAMGASAAQVTQFLTSRGYRLRRTVEYGDTEWVYEASASATSSKR